jgi:hypothetical protein
MSTVLKEVMPVAPLPLEQRKPPVRVQLRRVHAGLSEHHPPEGNEKVWQARLQKALGTTSGDFVEASLHQLQAAARLPGSGVSELAVNAGLALIESAAPRNEIEGALSVQMAGTHMASMTMLGRFANHCTASSASPVASAAARLMRSFAVQVETLRRLRHGGNQVVRVEHVHVHDGGQAVIGVLQPNKPEGKAA